MYGHSFPTVLRDSNIIMKSRRGLWRNDDDGRTEFAERPKIHNVHPHPHPRPSLSPRPFPIRPESH